MFRKLIGSFALGLVAAASAQAAVETRSVEIVGSLNDFGSVGTSFEGRVVGAGNSFIDTYAFVLSEDSQVFGGFSSVFRYRGNSVVRGIAFESITLSGGALSTNSPPDFNYDFLAAGSYVLTLTGRALGTQGGSYGGEFIAAPAIPEPSSVLLTLAGVAAVATVARRRSVV